MTGWFVCPYFGNPEECAECGGFNQTGTQFCSHDCAAGFAKRGAEMDRREDERRERERVFGELADALTRAGREPYEVDRILAWLPT